MTRKKQVLLSILSGLLMVPAWYSWGTGLILLIAFIPLLFVEAHLVATGYKGSRYFFLPFLCFFVWNSLTTWWIYNASPAGLVAALLVNTSLMTIAFWLFTVTHRKLGGGFGYFSLLFYWIGYEYLYLNGEISWTWLNLGNGFANNISIIQWYEFTGSLGGTAWVLLVNLLLFKSLKYWLENKKLKPVLTETVLATILILFPPVYSSVIYNNFEETENPYEIAVIQPNIDPYEKFNDIPPDEQMDILLHIADSLGTATTDYFVAPETFINNNLWISHSHKNPSIRKLKEFMLKYPDAEFVIGATTYQHYDNEKEATATAKPYQDDKFYDSYNSALQIDTSENIPIYHKSQLVVGVEKMPYASALKWLGKLTLKLGGTMRSHGSQENRETLVNIHDNTKVGPVICYESIFGEYVTDYVKEADANFLFVITNDGWWADTPGYIQHNSFSSLRAIETRRSIARSANTGISAFFNQRGDVIQSLGWWKRGGLSGVLNANDELTFYVRYGDYLGRISVFTGIAMLLYTLVKILLDRGQRIVSRQ